MPESEGVQKIIPHLWFDDQAEEAASFYSSLFDDARVGATTRYGKAGFETHGRPEGSVMTVEFELAGCEFIALNGGPTFEFTPAISFFVSCETEAEVDALWGALSEDGAALMPLDRYDWSDKYGWVQDRYGLSWQVALGDPEDVGQKITPSLLYVGDQFGRAEEAVRALLAEAGCEPKDTAGGGSAGQGRRSPPALAVRLKYVFLSERARAEAQVLQRQPGLIEALDRKSVV